MGLSRRYAIGDRTEWEYWNDLMDGNCGMVRAQIQGFMKAFDDGSVVVNKLGCRWQSAGDL